MLLYIKKLWPKGQSIQFYQRLLFYMTLALVKQNIKLVSALRRENDVTEFCFLAKYISLFQTSTVTIKQQCTTLMSYSFRAWVIKN